MYVGGRQKSKEVEFLIIDRLRVSHTHKRHDSYNGYLCTPLALEIESTDEPR